MATVHFPLTPGQPIDPIAAASAKLKHDIKSAIAAFRGEAGVMPCDVLVNIVNVQSTETGRSERHVRDVVVRVEV